MSRTRLILAALLAAGAVTLKVAASNADTAAARAGLGGLMALAGAAAACTLLFGLGRKSDQVSR